MYVGLNDLSLEGQFDDANISDLLVMLGNSRMAMKAVGGELRCSRSILNRPVTKNRTVTDWLQQLPNGNNIKRALLSWLNKDGPFLEDDLQHNIGMTFESCGRIVTDSMVAELAHRQYHRMAMAVAAVSISPSTMSDDPLRVLSKDLQGGLDIELRNHVSLERLKAWLATLEPPMQSWSALASRAQRECPSIVFARDAFVPLNSHPFGQNIAENLLERLLILQRLKECFDDDGQLTEQGQELRRLHFEGGQKPWFSNSSQDEMNQFRSRLTFAHPEIVGERLFCPWHGKVWTGGQWRIHFSDPITKKDPLYVVYVGMKLTKR